MLTAASWMLEHLEKMALILLNKFHLFAKVNDEKLSLKINVKNIEK